MVECARLLGELHGVVPLSVQLMMADGLLEQMAFEQDLETVIASDYRSRGDVC